MHLLQAAEDGEAEDPVDPDAPQPLTEEEDLERKQLLDSGFSNWSRRDYTSFTRACEKVTLRNTLLHSHCDCMEGQDSSGQSLPLHRMDACLSVHSNSALHAMDLELSNERLSGLVYDVTFCAMLINSPEGAHVPHRQPLSLRTDRPSCAFLTDTDIKLCSAAWAACHC